MLIINHRGMFGEANPCLLGLAMNGMADGHWTWIAHVIKQPARGAMHIDNGNLVSFVIISNHATSPCKSKLALGAFMKRLGICCKVNFHEARLGVEAILGVHSFIGHEDGRHAPIGPPSQRP